MGKNDVVQYIIQRSCWKSNFYFLGFYYGDHLRNYSWVLVMVEGTPFWAKSPVSAIAYQILWQAGFIFCYYGCVSLFFFTAVYTWDIIPLLISRGVLWSKLNCLQETLLLDTALMGTYIWVCSKENHHL